jgi:hypothetical protein
MFLIKASKLYFFRTDAISNFGNFFDEENYFALKLSRNKCKNNNRHSLNTEDTDVKKLQ